MVKLWWQLMVRKVEDRGWGGRAGLCSKGFAVTVKRRKRSFHRWDEPTCRLVKLVPSLPSPPLAFSGNKSKTRDTAETTAEMSTADRWWWQRWWSWPQLWWQQRWWQRWWWWWWQWWLRKCVDRRLAAFSASAIRLDWSNRGEDSKFDDDDYHDDGGGDDEDDGVNDDAVDDDAIR